MQTADHRMSDRIKDEISHLLDTRGQGGLYAGFNHELEKRYVEYARNRFSKINISYPFFGAVGLLLFLFSDYQIAPNAMPEFLFARLAGVAIVVGLALILWRDQARDDAIRNHHINNLVISVATLLVHLLLLYIGAIAALHGELHYQTGSMILIVLYCAVVRVDFRYTAPTVMVIWLTQLLFSYLYLNNHSVLVEHAFMFTSVAFFSCLANARMEHETRKTFLQEQLISIEQQELEETKQQLYLMSISDPLTGLANRRGFDQQIQKSWSFCLRTASPLSLLMIDVDFFKQYNDTLGHSAGDEALKQVGKVIAETVKRPEDIVARFGGEEFIVALPNTDKAAAYGIAERVRQRVYQLGLPHPATEASVITISIGLATETPTISGEFRALLNEADESLYEAKRQGRNRVLPEVLCT